MGSIIDVYRITDPRIFSVEVMIDIYRITSPRTLGMEVVIDMYRMNNPRTLGMEVVIDMYSAISIFRFFGMGWIIGIFLTRILQTIKK
jgi:hypothetical protein